LRLNGWKSRKSASSFLFLLRHFHSVTFFSFNTPHCLCSGNDFPFSGRLLMREETRLLKLQHSRLHIDVRPLLTAQFYGLIINMKYIYIFFTKFRILFRRKDWLDWTLHFITITHILQRTDYGKKNYWKKPKKSTNRPLALLESWFNSAAAASNSAMTGLELYQQIPVLSFVDWKISIREVLCNTTLHSNGRHSVARVILYPN